MSFPAVYLGDFHAAGTAMLALVPRAAASGENVRAVRLLAREALKADAQNYWLLRVGVLEANGLKVMAQVSLADGFVEGLPRTVVFPGPLLVSRGWLLACSLVPSGSPPPLIGLSAVVEWGILSSDRTAR